MIPMIMVSAIVFLHHFSFALGYPLIAAKLSKILYFKPKSIERILPIIFWTIQVVMLIWWCSVPVFYVPKTWFGPFLSWLKFPFAPEGSVGIFYWWSALSSFLNRLFNIFIFLHKKYKMSSKNK
jgi:hypothetical protein